MLVMVPHRTCPVMSYLRLDSRRNFDYWATVIEHEHTHALVPVLSRRGHACTCTVPVLSPRGPTTQCPAKLVGYCTVDGVLRCVLHAVQYTAHGSAPNNDIVLSSCDIIIALSLRKHELKGRSLM